MKPSYLYTYLPHDCDIKCLLFILLSTSYSKQVYLKIYNQYTVIDWVQGQQLLFEEPVYN